MRFSSSPEKRSLEKRMHDLSHRSDSCSFYRQRAHLTAPKICMCAILRFFPRVDIVACELAGKK